MELYPLIDLKKTEQPPFWVYNNYAYVYHQYLESYKKDTHYYVMGDYQKKPKLDESLEIELSKNQNLRGINFIKNESFEWVEQTYYGHLAEIEFMFVYDWTSSDYTINCFSVLYDLKENEIPWDNNEISNIKIYDFKSAGLYPDSEQLDLLVKDYLKNIEPDLSLSKEFELREKGYHLTKDNIYSFFQFHLNSCEGDIYDFVNHGIELTNDIWRVNNSKNIKKKKYFDLWLSQTIEVHELDRSKLKLEQNIISKITKKKEELNISELNKLSPESYYDRDLGLVPSPLYLNLNNRLENSKNAYDTISKLSKGMKEYWGDSFEDIKRKNVFNEWLNNIIEEHNLDRSKLGLEPVTTPEPPQVQQNENIAQPLVKIRWNAPKNVLTSIFVQLKQMNTNQNNPVIDNSYEDIAVFLKTNFDCYQDTEISTITTTLKNQSSGNNTPKQTKLIEIRKTDL